MRGLKSPCLALFPFKILLTSQASRLDRRRPPSFTSSEEEKRENLLLPGDEGQLCLLKLLHLHQAWAAGGWHSLQFLLTRLTPAQSPFTSSWLSILVTSFRVQEELTSLICRADTKAHLYLSHCVFLQVSFPIFHANTSICGYLCSRESDCPGWGKLWERNTRNQAMTRKMRKVDISSTKLWWKSNKKGLFSFPFLPWLLSSPLFLPFSSQRKLKAVSEKN